MTPDELKAREEELRAREDALKSREDELARQTAEKGKTTADTSNTPASNASASYVASIKVHVPITLDLQDSNYAKWRELFLVALGRYGLTAHVISDDDATPSNTSPTSEWARDDYTVLSWIYGSISTELFGIIMAPGSSARKIWLAIDNLFRDNKKSRAIALDAEFRNTPQGDMTISDYCAKLKGLADALADVGQTVTDETLVLTMLRGLNDQYAHLRSFLPFQVPFPTFLHTRSSLVLEEAQKKTDAKNNAATVLWASGNSVLPSAGSERSSSSGGDRSLGRGNGSTGGFSNTGNGISIINRGGGGGGRGRGRGGRGRGRDTPWMYNPWTGLPTRAHLQHQQPAPQWQPQPQWQQRQAWRGSAPSLLGPRPGMAQPHAYAAYSHAPQQQQTTTPTQYQQQQLDPALLNALNNMQFPGNNDWYMDSGASSHMASDAGPSQSDRDSSMQ